MNPSEDITTRGIVLRVRPLTESSLILHWITPDYGRIATVAKGARRPKSPFRGVLDLFHEAQIGIRKSRRSSLHLLREAALVDGHTTLRREWLHLQQASYAAALIEQSTEEESPLHEVYALYSGFLGHLSNSLSGPNAMMAFELRYLDRVGLRPPLDRAGLSPGTQRILASLSTSAWGELHRLELAPAEHAEARGFLGDFLSFHLGRVLPNRASALGE